MPKLDDASWHWGGDDFPGDLAEDAGATHIGMFVAWAVLKGLWAEEADWPDELAKVRRREMTGAEFLMILDGKFVSEDLTPEGAAFAEAYYPDDYLGDYRRVLVRDLAWDYAVEDTWANYDKIAAVLDERWVKNRS